MQAKIVANCDFGVERPQGQLALYAVQRLSQAGFIAFFAGGCVRDALLGRIPKDFDVATSATPEQVRKLFGNRRTLPIGAAFGVISLLGKPQFEETQLDIATFRSDGAYVDGRRPSHVDFSSPEADAQRRDFTINGLFYDPLTTTIIDYVQGQADLARGVIRAIGNPEARIAEDKLRMLRAIRFSAEFAFDIEPATLEAIRASATAITVVSGERIAAEMRRILSGRHPDLAIRLLEQVDLLKTLLPELADHWLAPAATCDGCWKDAIPRLLATLSNRDFAASLGGLLLPARAAMKEGLTEPLTLATANSLVAGVASRWRLSSSERQGAAYALANFPEILRAKDLAWSRVQPILVDKQAVHAIDLAEAWECQSNSPDLTSIEFCRGWLRRSREELDPPPLLTGDDLQTLGFTPGPAFREALKLVRSQQLDGLIASRAESLEIVDRFLRNR